MEENKVVLVTGSSSGFGKLIVETLAKKGYDVYASMRGVNSKNSDASESLKKWAKENNLKIKVLELDVTNNDSVNDSVNKIIEKEGKIDVVVNNAGIGVFGTNESYSAEQAKILFDVNVLGPMRINNAVLPKMRERKSGLLVQISSVLGRTLIPLTGVYSASKFAVEALSESYRYELASQGVDSVIIQPGGYPTNFVSNSIMPDKKEVNEQYGEFTQKVMGMFNEYTKGFEKEDGPKPQEVAEAVLRVIETPAGERPMRTSIGTESPIANMINDHTGKVQADFLKNLGLSDDTKLKK